MKTIRIIPGNIVATNPHTIPTGAPLIDRVVSAEITRITDTITLGHGAGAAFAHADGAVVSHANMAVAAHAAHMHDIISQGAGAPPPIPLGFDAVAPPTQVEDFGAAVAHTFPGGGGTGIQDGALDAHGVTQADDHTPAETIAGLADHPGADIAAALINHAAAGATPVVAAGPTRDTARTFQLDVDTELGDLLVLSYVEVGERILVA